ncbi:hypothetical protein [Shewanella colwelliana]
MLTHSTFTLSLMTLRAVLSI